MLHFFFFFSNFVYELDTYWKQTLTVSKKQNLKPPKKQKQSLFFHSMSPSRPKSIWHVFFSAASSTHWPSLTKTSFYAQSHTLCRWCPPVPPSAWTPRPERTPEPIARLALVMANDGEHPLNHHFALQPSGWRRRTLKWRCTRVWFPFAFAAFDRLPRWQWCMLGCMNVFM